MQRFVIHANGTHAKPTGVIVIQEAFLTVKLNARYFAEKTIIKVGNEIVHVKPFQIIVWVSITSDMTSNWDPRTPRIPAILDIGNNHNFAITESQLTAWAGIAPAGLPIKKYMREQGERVPLRQAGVWLRTDNDPFQLIVESGIALYRGSWPRLPILGLRALTNSKLQTLIYGDTMQVLIRTPRVWYWPF